MPQSRHTLIGIQARVLTPFYYHGLYAKDGSATHAGVITDTAVMFGLRQALQDSSPLLRSQPDYKADLLRIPWRASLLLGTHNELLAPVRHTIDVSREGGFHESMQKNIGSGNFKNTFFVHEVTIGSTYQGLLWGLDPFQLLGNPEKFVIRVGVGRLGMLEISRQPAVKEVHLNTATAKLFNRQLPEAYRILDTIRVSQALSVAEAGEELQKWY